MPLIGLVPKNCNGILTNSYDWVAAPLCKERDNGVLMRLVCLGQGWREDAPRGTQAAVKKVFRKVLPGREDVGRA